MSEGERLAAAMVKGSWWMPRPGTNHLCRARQIERLAWHKNWRGELFIVVHSRSSGAQTTDVRALDWMIERYMPYTPKAEGGPKHE